MIYQIKYEPERDPLPHNIYQRSDIKAAGEWRISFESEAEAHRWIKANSQFTATR